MKQYSEIILRAYRLAKEKHPKAGPYKWSAFANAVAYSVTALIGGFLCRSSEGYYFGPSVREHAAARVAPPCLSFEKATEILLKDDGVIFGPLTDLHQWCWLNENCFDDDPADVRELSGQMLH